MQFANPNLLLHALWVLPGILLLAWWGERRRRRKLAGWVSNPALADSLTSNVSKSRRRWRLGLLLAVAVLLIAAVARPQWGTQLVRSPSRSRDVLVVLDVSRSMLARDIAPSRLQHAKYLIRSVVRSFPGDRFGLVLFAGEAFLECPLTQNRSGFELFLDDADTDSVPVGGTNLQAALETAAKAFEAAESKHQGVLLITDGDELQGDVSKVLDTFREKKIPIFVVGIGDPVLGSYIQIAGNKFVTDADGNRVRTKLNEEGLQRISKTVGGSYVRSTVAYDGADHLIQKIRGLIPDDKQSESNVRPIERYQVPLFLALLLAMIRLGLGERRDVVAEARRLETAFSRGAAVLALILLCLAAAPPVRGQDDTGGAPGNGAVDPSIFQQPPAKQPAPSGQPAKPKLTQAQQQALQRQALSQQIIKSYQDRLDKSVDPVEQAWCHYNLGVAYQQAGQPEQAASQYQDAIDQSTELPDLRARAYQNLGTLKHQEALSQIQADPDKAIDELGEARRNYREAMRLAKDPTPIATDQELALRHEQIAKQIKKLQQQMSQQQQDAKDSLDKSVKEQQQANQSQDSQQKQQHQQQSKQSNQEAQQKLQEMSDQARKQGMDKAADQVDQLKKQLQEAEKKQDKALDKQTDEKGREQAGKDAQEKLEQAQQAMTGKPKDDGEKKEGEGAMAKDKDDKDQKDKDDKQGAAGEQPPDQQPPTDDKQAAAPHSGGEQTTFDKQQALRILEEMEKNEGGDISKEIKRQMREDSKLSRPERDW